MVMVLLELGFFFRCCFLFDNWFGRQGLVVMMMNRLDFFIGRFMLDFGLFLGNFFLLLNSSRSRNVVFVRVSGISFDVLLSCNDLGRFLG